MKKQARRRSVAQPAPGAAENRPFASLKAAITRRSGERTTKPADLPAPTRPLPDEADQALFRKQVQGARPLREDNRALLDKPRPAPLPRPKDTDDEADEDTTAPPPRRGTATDDELFLAAMDGVKPLADGNRVVLQRPRGLPRPIAAGPPKREAALPDAGATPEQLLDWAHAGATPLKDASRAELERPRPAPLPRQSELDEEAVLRESIDTPLSFEDRLDIGDEAVFLRNGLPRRVLGDLRRGRWVVQHQLDLHGMTRDEARLALAQFLAACLKEGKRCVRLIHGKGLGSPGGVGILKQLSRGWLAQREEILAFCQARPHEGGSGALLILLRAGNAHSGARQAPPRA